MLWNILGGWAQGSRQQLARDVAHDSLPAPPLWGAQHKASLLHARQPTPPGPGPAALGLGQMRDRRATVHTPEQTSRSLGGRSTKARLWAPKIARGAASGQGWAADFTPQASLAAQLSAPTTPAGPQSRSSALRRWARTAAGPPTAEQTCHPEPSLSPGPRKGPRCLGAGGTGTAPCLPFMALGLGLGYSSVSQSGPKAKERRTVPPRRARRQGGNVAAPRDREPPCSLLVGVFVGSGETY